MELTVTYSNNRWIAYDEERSFHGKTLDEVDSKIREFVINSGLLRSRSEYRVRMYFNNAVIPAWMRQYAQHYFNRELVIKAHQEE